MKIFLNKLLGYYQFIVFAISYLKPTSFNEVDFLKNYLREGAVVFDVGANVGTYTKTLSKYLNFKDVHFFLFEPNKNIVKTLDNLKIKNSHNKTVVNKAVNNNPAEKDVTFFERNISAYSSLSENNLTENHKIIDSYQVNTTSLDLFIDQNNLSSIDLVKIDTEGLDFDVLKSLEKSFKQRKVKILKIELIPNSEDFYNIFKFLNMYDFELSGILNLSHVGNKVLLFDAYFINKSEINE